MELLTAIHIRRHYWHDPDVAHYQDVVPPNLMSYYKAYYPMSMPHEVQCCVVDGHTVRYHHDGRCRYYWAQHRHGEHVVVADDRDYLAVGRDGNTHFVRTRRFTVERSDVGRLPSWEKTYENICTPIH